MWKKQHCTSFQPLVADHVIFVLLPLPSSATDGETGTGQLLCFATHIYYILVILSFHWVKKLWNCQFQSEYMTTVNLASESNSMKWPDCKSTWISISSDDDLTACWESHYKGCYKYTNETAKWPLRDMQYLHFTLYWIIKIGRRWVLHCCSQPADLSYSKKLFQILNM